jgi:hypothetical protein
LTLPIDWHNPGTYTPVGGGGGSTGTGSVSRTGVSGGVGRTGTQGASQYQRKRPTQAARFPNRPDEEDTDFPDVPMGGKNQPMIQYPIGEPPPIDREALLRHSMNPPQPNMYRDIPGFEDYQGGFQLQGDALSRFGKMHSMPGRGGYPTRDRVQGISNAMQQMQGMKFGPTMSGTGHGAEVSSQDDIIRRLLRERLGIGGQ